VLSAAALSAREGGTPSKKIVRTLWRLVASQPVERPAATQIAIATIQAFMEFRGAAEACAESLLL
jgi:hypothetical protein